MKRSYLEYHTIGGSESISAPPFLPLSVSTMYAQSLSRTGSEDARKIWAVPMPPAASTTTSAFIVSTPASKVNAVSSVTLIGAVTPHLRRRSAESLVRVTRRSVLLAS